MKDTACTILLIEDEKHVADVIQKGLEEEGYHVIRCADGLSGLETLYNHRVHLVLLDILLPKMNGLEVCRKMREEGFNEIPILMLTALGSAENVVLGLDSGADDYLAKPFKFIELNARIRTLLRRAEFTELVTAKPENMFRFADIELNDDMKIAKRAGIEMSLTSTEYRLLRSFLKSQKKVLSRMELLNEVWGYNFDIGTNVVDVYVNYLRKKLDKCGKEKLIHTVIGMGYVLKRQE
ncbi:MAG TPA: response regulator transcription factor [Cyclobacteriaceae bacterium]|jgi:DNA-binding response OmpR family regulator|nr:response regulator transcription factor [Cyclobacteriaceae bacterium]